MEMLASPVFLLRSLFFPLLIEQKAKKRHHRPYLFFSLHFFFPFLNLKF